MKLPIYKENNVSFFCSLNTDNGYGSGQLIVSYHHKSNETLWHKADIIISNGLHFILDTHKKITDRLVLSFGIINLLNQEYFAFAFKPSISFKISDKINTSITWQTALPSTITKTIHFRSHSTKIDVKINFSILNSYLSINNSYLYSDKLRLFNKNKLSYNGFNQAVGFHYVFNKFSSCSAFFNFGTFGSIYFDLR